MIEVSILRQEEKRYAIKNSNKTQLSRITVYSCNICGKECRTETRKLKNISFTGNCKSCLNKGKPFQFLYTHFLWISKKRNIENLISYEEFLEFTLQNNCFYCDDKIPWKKYSKWHAGSAGYFLDRKNGLLGYIKENCVVCCKDCNFTKASRYTFEEFCLFKNILKEIKRARLK